MSERGGPEVFADAASLVRVAARAVAGALGAALEARAVALFAGAGGRTPAPVYEQLAHAPLAWAQVFVTLTDERWVDPASADSNAGLLRRTLLKDRATQARFLPLKAAGASPAAAADAASNALAAGPSPIDCVLLGMGEDGHVASIFPRNPSLPTVLARKPTGLCLPVPVGPDGAAPLQPRLTLAMSAITSARSIVLVVRGDEKRRTLERALSGDDVEVMPVRAVLHSRAPLRVLWAP